MPWKETCPMDERMQFISGYLDGSVSVTQLCAQAGISRKTGNKWIGRYEREGPRGLIERSRARHEQEHRTPADKVERIIQVIRKLPGGKS